MISQDTGDTYIFLRGSFKLQFLGFFRMVFMFCLGLIEEIFTKSSTWSHKVEELWYNLCQNTWTFLPEGLKAQPCFTGYFHLLKMKWPLSYKILSWVPQLFQNLRARPWVAKWKCYGYDSSLWPDNPNRIWKVYLGFTGVLPDAIIYNSFPQGRNILRGMPSNSWLGCTYFTSSILGPMKERVAKIEENWCDSEFNLWNIW